MKKALIIWFAVHLFLLQVLHLHAQSSLVFKSINVDNGLPQNTVLSVLQDKRGYLWVSTFDGLSRFNGLEFKVFKNQVNNNKSISSNKISKLFLDNAGNLWVGATDCLNLFDSDTETFRHFSLSANGSSNGILSMAQDKNNVLWVGTNNGLYYLKKKSGTNDYAVVKSNIYPLDKITCLYIDDKQNMWMGAGQALKIYDLNKKALVPLPVPMQAYKNVYSSIVRSIIQDGHKNYWIGTETEGLFYYCKANNTCYNYTQATGLLSNTVRAVYECQNNEIWTGTKKGLNIINTKTRQISQFVNDTFDPNSISQNSIRCIFKDHGSNVWIGTFNGGLNCVYSQYDNFHSLGLKSGKSNSLSYSVVNAVEKDTRGGFWIGTDDGGLNHVDSNLQHNHIYYQYNGPSRELLGNSIKAIAAHPDTNKLWIATGSGGLSIFNKSTGTFTNTNILKKPSEAGFIQNYALLNDGNGLWIGTNFNGLYYLPFNGSLQHINAISSNINTLLRDGDYLWVGLTNKGVVRLTISNQQVSSYQHNPQNLYSLHHNTVNYIYKDHKGRLWVCTDGGGLAYFDTKANKFYAINEGFGIGSNTTHGVLEDKLGRLWVSTNKGLSSIAFKKFKPPFNKADLAIENYTIADGLQGNQFVRGAVTEGSNGNMAFAGINGITAFNPVKIKINSVKPDVVFTDFSIFNRSVPFDEQGSPLQKPIDETEEITLSYSQAFFSIKFAALNYINPEKNQFAFKLDGFSDNEWHYVGNQRIATYTNLDPGTYYFKIKAANNDGVWNPNARVLKITVLPPWYKTWYAFAGYLAIIIFLLYLFNVYSIKTERLKNELKYESLSHSKDQELAQKQLSFFVNISHEIKTPLTMIMAPLERMIAMNVGNNKVLNQLMLMQRNGERLIRLINQLLDKKKLETGHMQLQAAEGDIVGFVKEIALAFDGLAKLKNISLRFTAKQQPVNMWFDRDKLEKVLYNLVSNAIKFTPDYGKIILSVAIADKQVIITVEDNGCGVPAQNIDKIFTQFYHYDNHIKIEGTGLGLAFSKELVDLHHGELSVESRTETPSKAGYTCFTIKLPLGKEHLKGGEIAGDFKDSEDILSYQTEHSVKAQLQQKKADILKKERRDSFSMLIVEDNEDVLNFIKEGFADEFEVYSAVNGSDGWVLAKEISPDIIISDVMMPGLNGIELCSKLKSDIDTSHIPVILLTARTQLIFKMEGLETGADDYITKPFNFNMIDARVWNLIENRQKLRERYQKEIKLEPQNIAISNLDEAFLTKVLSYIEQHVTDPDLSVEQLSQQVAMSKSSFYKKIKSLTNQTGVEFIRSVRIKRAAQLLAQGQLTINEVAYMVGFMDVDYFRKCFKEQFKYTPKEHPVSKTNEV
ncbi:response regulator [Mucilaginibacter sp. HMF5004]|uniref:hybrid sensor histidine kinase/response regulator transcription factor n=1 Tax=Mucilaginibacter rivuli TaxID=2857527 RepID=UPI001C5EDACA|nr:two-component regulator propeller domain-containing protein [Mucilaginibacter rivuli]MBW4889233.1 response regulator [Mucilaginibacter rivuli]